MGDQDFSVSRGACKISTLAGASVACEVPLFAGRSGVRGIASVFAEYGWCEYVRVSSPSSLPDHSSVDASLLGVTYVGTFTVGVVPCSPNNASASCGVPLPFAGRSGVSGTASVFAEYGRCEYTGEESPSSLPDDFLIVAALLDVARGGTFMLGRALLSTTTGAALPRYMGSGILDQ